MSVSKQWQRPGWPIIIIGVLLISAGVFYSSASLMRFLRGDSAVLTDELLTGAAYLRICLTLLGLIILVMGGLPIWDKVEKKEGKEDGRSPHIRWLLIGLLAVSFLIRLIQLNVGLWIDEILTLLEFARLPMGELVTTYTTENQHFLFSIMARISFVIFGESGWALRLPAVLFGVGSIWALFEFGRYVASEREGLLAAALLAFSYHHVWFSQNARGYSGLLFWTILASWLLLRALDTSEARLWVWYALAAALGMYTHMTMMFVIFAHFVIYLARLFRQRRRNWGERWFGLWLGFPLTGFLILLLYSPVLPQLFTTISATESVVAEWRNPLWTLMELVNGIMVSFAGGLVVLGWIMVLAAFSLFAAGLVSYWRSQDSLLFLLFVPSVVGGGLTVALGHHLWPRFFLFTFGFAALVVVRGVLITGHRLAEKLNQPPVRAAQIGLALCVVMILVSAASVAFAFGPKQDFAGALAYVEANQQPGDRVAAIHITGNVYRNYYELDWVDLESLDDLESLEIQPGRIWVVYTFKPVLRSKFPEVMQAIEDEFELMDMFPGSVRQGAVFVSMLDEGSS